MIVFGIVVVVSLVGIIWWIGNAPEGYEDETGFHFGRKDHTE